MHIFQYATSLALYSHLHLHMFCKKKVHSANVVESYGHFGGHFGGLCGRLGFPFLSGVLIRYNLHLARSLDGWT